MDKLTLEISMDDKGLKIDGTPNFPSEGPFTDRQKMILQIADYIISGLDYLQQKMAEVTAPTDDTLQ